MGRGELNMNKPYIESITFGENSIYISYSDSNPSIDYYHALNLSKVNDIYETDILLDIGPRVKINYNTFVNTDKILPKEKKRIEKLAKLIGYEIQYIGNQTAVLHHPSYGAE